MRDLISANFQKAHSRILALSQEMAILWRKGSAGQGNEGLQRTAAMLFDPNIDFYTVYQSTRAVATTTRIAYEQLTGFAPGLVDLDTVRLLHDLHQTLILY